MKKQSGTGLLRLLHACGWSIKGLQAALRHEAAFRQETILFLFLAPLGLWLGHDNVDKALLVGSLLLVLIVELLNSAVEAVVDRIGPERHELAARAKDLGSAAVLLTLCLAVLTWVLILLP